jgi:hypothetical protein
MNRRGEEKMDQNPDEVSMCSGCYAPFAILHCRLVAFERC